MYYVDINDFPDARPLYMLQYLRFKFFPWYLTKALFTFVLFIIILIFVSQVTDLKISVDLLEKERDFYFSKLRDIEILCQTTELENEPVRIVAKACSLVNFTFTFQNWGRIMNDFLLPKFPNTFDCLEIS